MSSRIKGDNEYQIFGIPGCLAPDTSVVYLRGNRKGGRDISIEDLYYRMRGRHDKIIGRHWAPGLSTYLLCLKENGLLGYSEMHDVVYSGKKEVWLVRLSNGIKIKATLDHKVKCGESGDYIKLSDMDDESVWYRELQRGSKGKKKRTQRKECFLKDYPFDTNIKEIRCRKTGRAYRYHRVRRSRIVYEAWLNGISTSYYIEALNKGRWDEENFIFLDPNYEVHHVDGDVRNDIPENLVPMLKDEHAKLHGPNNQKNLQNVVPQRARIKSIEFWGRDHTYDIQMKGPEHNFVASNIIVHNSGKTTTLSKAVENAASQVGGENLIISSFTRAAAQELVSRDLPVPDQNIGTLHSLCYRALGTPPLAEKYIKQFNEEYPRCALSAKQHIDIDDEGQDSPHDDNNTIGDSDAWFQEYNINRAKMLPEEKWSPQATFFARNWEEWKEANGYVDFTDMISICLRDAPYPPGAPLIGIFDEAQDFTPLQLELVRSWANQLRYILIAGDDDQASAPWSLIKTTKHGWVRADELDPNRHALTTYRIDKSRISGHKGRGQPFYIEKSRYNDYLVSIWANNKTTDVTYNHPCLFRFNEEAYSATCVYLMQKGSSFRVGWCQVLRADGCSHIGVRAHAEGAEYLWILTVCKSRSEASLWESFVAAHFGISTCVWKPMHEQSNGHYSQEVIEELFDMLGDQTERAKKCLAYFDKYYDQPFYIKNKRTSYGSCNYLVAACNLFPDIMNIPIFDSTKNPKDADCVRWSPIAEIRRELYADYVYGLSVERDHTYIADGVITHNCIYSFTGADPSVLLNEDLPDERKRILSHSFRCPKAVQDHARFWIEKISDREPKEQHPRQENSETVLGQVDRIPYRYTESERVVDEIEDSLKEMPREKEVMVLTSCSYMLSPILSELRRRGIPFANRYKKRRGDWNPLRLDGKSKSTASRVLSYLEPEGPVFQGSRLWTTQQLRNWIELCNSSGFLQKGSKNTIIQAAEEDLSKKGLFELIANSFKPEKLDQALQLELDFLRRNLSATKAKAFEFPETVICRRGVEELKQKPRVTVGTIHSVKGGQADHVILFPDISYRAAQNAEADRESNQAVIRAFYVGMTRARERLTIGEPRSGLHIYI